MNKDQTTRTPETEEMYRSRVKGMIKQACRDGYVKDSKNVNPKEISLWLRSNKGKFCAATFRLYKAAFQMWIEENTHPDGPAAIELLNGENNIPCLKRHMSKQTSALKDKKFSDADRMAVIDWLKNHPSKYSAALSFWLRIGVVIGLRPSEFKSAQVIKNEDGGFELRVKNAKATNGRSNGETRTLLLNGLPIEMIRLIEDTLKLFSKMDKVGKWSGFYKGCRTKLEVVGRKLWPKRKKFPSLYSLRHQFAADAKSSGMSKIEVAALMGHANQDTAGSHYAQRKVGRGSCAVTPSQEDVERLVSKAQFVQPKTNGSKT